MVGEGGVVGREGWWGGRGGGEGVVKIWAGCWDGVTCENGSSHMRNNSVCERVVCVCGVCVVCLYVWCVCMCVVCECMCEGLWLYCIQLRQ